MAQLDVNRFYARLSKLHSHFVKHREGAAWGGATCLSLHRGPLNEDDIFLKSIVLQQYLFGYELPDTVLILTAGGKCMVLATKKKCEFLQPAVDGAPKDCKITEFEVLVRNKADGNQENFEKMLSIVKGEKENGRVGLFLKEKAQQNNEKSKGETIFNGWEKKLEESSLKLVDVAAGVGLTMSQKDSVELDLLRKSAVLSNKVLKHGLVPRIEEIIDSELSESHEKVSGYVDSIVEDPSKIKLKVPKEHVQSCYFPIVQSGGDYDIRISAQSSKETLKYDIVMASLGARYQFYCTNISRTFLVDPPKRVSKAYETLLAMQSACLHAMKPGNALKGVYAAALKYLKGSGNEDLVNHLPKNLGFSLGLDFRESALVLTSKNPAVFRADMVFALTVGFTNVPLTEEEKATVSAKSASKNLKNFGLLLGDTVCITNRQAEVMTKHSKDLTDISYTINDEEEEEEDEEEEEVTTKIPITNNNGKRQSARLKSTHGNSAEMQEGAAEREKRQIDLMGRKNEERLREQARANSKNTDEDGPNNVVDELETYDRTEQFPDYVLPNQVKVDMSRECVILPICGNPIPFHISTIKNVVLPDPDTASYLRINFFTAGVAIGKDTPANTVKLIAKYAPFATFIREMTFRSLDANSLTHAYRQISELRKRNKLRETREQEEANLVKQDKLIRTKNERVPRLSDLTMRPVFAGRKTQGNLEAHTNGLRFISIRKEIVDILYSNIKHAIFQPCENEIMVLVHFHLKNPIMVGKKRQRDIQFFTEVIDTSLQVDAGRHRYGADPDEMDDEQRERQLRKKLNEAFKEFCRKVENVVKKNGYSLDFDIPYRDLGFQGAPSKEMVTVQPTLNCLVNLSETPFFVVDLSGVDHVHFERVTFMSNSFDMVLINKVPSKQPWRVDMIPNDEKDSIQDWLTDMEISYTEGPMNLNWKQIMMTVAGDERFYMNTHEDEVTEKDAGWEFLRMFGKEDVEDDDDEDDDSEFSDEKENAAGKSEEESEEESEFDSESEEESDYDADEDLEEQGMDWEDMEREAAADDRRKRMGDQSGTGNPEPDRERSRQRGSRPVGRSSGGRPSGGRPSGGMKAVPRKNVRSSSSGGSRPMGRSSQSQKRRRR